MIQKIKYMVKSALTAAKVYDLMTATKYEPNRLLGEIVRNTHSIEKGLSLESVRLGFGYAKIKEAAGIVERFGELNGGSIDVEQVGMFASALSDYIKFHNERQFASGQFDEIKDIYRRIEERLTASAEKLGGALKVVRPHYTEAERAAIERVIRERHSVREFEKTSVSDGDLRSAIELAMRCPSACNRQCYRVTVVDRADMHLLDGILDGVGGFADQIDKLLIITGRVSDYRLSEHFQHIVSASVFAAYLTITLQTYGIGCCFIQRQVLPCEKYDRVSKKLGIPGDDQWVCVLGIGNLKSEYRAPVSHRLSYDEIVRTVR